MPETSAARLSSFSPGAPVSPSSSDAEYDKLPVSQTLFHWSCAHKTISDSEAEIQAYVNSLVLKLQFRPHV